MSAELLAGIATSGTKIACAMADVHTPTGLLDLMVIPTQTSQTAVPQLRWSLAKYHQKRGISAPGIATFGPVDVEPDSVTYGKLLNTPTTACRDVDVHDILRDLECVLSAVVTHVDGSLLAEHRAWATKDTPNAAYITVGTGIGVSLMARG